MTKFQLKDRKRAEAISKEWQVVTADDRLNAYIELHPDWKERKFFTISSGWDGDKSYRVKPDDVEEAK